MNDYNSNTENYVEWRIIDQFEFDEYLIKDHGSYEILFCYCSYEKSIELTEEVIKDGKFFIDDYRLRLDTPGLDFNEWQEYLKKNNLNHSLREFDLDFGIKPNGEHASAYFEIYDYNEYFKRKIEYPAPLLDHIIGSRGRPVVFKISLYRYLNYTKEQNIFLNKFLPLMIEKLDGNSIVWMWMHEDGSITKSKNMV